MPPKRFSRQKSDIPHLTYIDLSYNENITDKGLEYISSGCQRLTIIILIDVAKITREGVLYVCQGCPQLVKVVVKSPLIPMQSFRRDKIFRVVKHLCTPRLRENCLWHLG